MLEKGEMFLEKDYFQKLLEIPNLHLLILAGKLVGNEIQQTDLFIVGNTEKEKLNAVNEVRILASIKSNFVISYKEAFFDENESFLG